MSPPPVPGTEGYERAVAAFVAASQALRFEHVNRDFLPLLPPAPARVLDAGAGAGQNAAALVALGYTVVAVEPFAPFLDAARAAYGDRCGTRGLWVQDSLPDLASLGETPEPFDVALVDGVWHHLSEPERARALPRLAVLLRTGGVCALSLRHGPAGAGTHVFPTDGPALTEQARAHGFEPALLIEGQPSLMPGKPDVTWTRLALRKVCERPPRPVRPR